MNIQNFKDRDELGARRYLQYHLLNTGNIIMNSTRFTSHFYYSISSSIQAQIFLKSASTTPFTCLIAVDTLSAL